MASIQSIRKLKLAQMDADRLSRFGLYPLDVGRLMAAAIDEYFKRLAEGLKAFTEMVGLFQPDHIFKVGDYATRDGSDVQRVTSVTDIFADFQCILPPHTGWCEAGEVEHNAMRRYRLLSKEEAEAMIKERWQGG